MNENTLKIIAVTLLCTTIVSGALALQYNYQYTQLREDYEITLQELDDYTVLVNILIDNGETRLWYNDTRVHVGESLLNATMQVVDVEFQMYDFGVFITSIDRVEGDNSHFWGWNIYEDSWEMGSVSANQYIVHDDDVVAWTYTSFE